MQGLAIKNKPQNTQTEPTPNDTTREQLVIKATKGRKDALQDLCKAVAQDILFSTTRILNNRSDAEDAAQEILIRLCTSIQDLKEPKAFGAWLGRIITNETRRIMLKNSRHSNVVSITDYLDTIEEENEEALPHDYTMKAEDRKQVLEIIETLPARQKEAIILHYYNGLSVIETAEAMDVKHQVASRYLKLAREKIKDELETKESGTWLYARGMTLLPIGSLLGRTLRQEAGAFANANSEWIKQILTNNPALVSTTATAAAASAAAISVGVAKTVTAVLLTITITTGIWVSVANTEEEEAPPNPIATVVASEYAISFTNNEESATQINPQQATAHVDTDHGEMTARFWWISREGTDYPLYSGEGSTVEKELAMMHDNGETGNYTLRFRMEDPIGNTYTLTRDFTITNTE